MKAILSNACMCKNAAVVIAMTTASVGAFQPLSSRQQQQRLYGNNHQLFASSFYLSSLSSTSSSSSSSYHFRCLFFLFFLIFLFWNKLLLPSLVKYHTYKRTIRYDTIQYVFRK
mmetsp:Transcript_13919/g.15527  ORF Transcript_13919/g.15527 Transcript_13919/m.15527 type:complete len:114 (+) Transcript_13919:49-390(+)